MAPSQCNNSLWSSVVRTRIRSPAYPSPTRRCFQLKKGQRDQDYSQFCINYSPFFFFFFNKGRWGWGVVVRPGRRNHHTQQIQLSRNGLFLFQVLYPSHLSFCGIVSETFAFVCLCFKSILRYFSHPAITFHRGSMFVTLPLSFPLMINFLKHNRLAFRKRRIRGVLSPPATPASFIFFPLRFIIFLSDVFTPMEPIISQPLCLFLLCVNFTFSERPISMSP